MKHAVFTFLVFNFSLSIVAQDVPSTTREQLEDLAEIQQAEIKDDSWIQQAEHFRKSPLNLNSAESDDIKELMFLTDLQIDNFISYRRLFGKLLSIYELQAIPSWDVTTIRKILPFVTITDEESLTSAIKKRFWAGSKTLLARVGETIEKSNGYNASNQSSSYLGGREKIFFRYRYQYRNLLQYGLLGDKDAGEKFFKGSERYGFDFYSFHFFMRKVGKIEALALGDFTVNLGQGLIQWQGLAFAKSSEAMNIKRQSTTLKPYSSSGEFYFQRGAGLTMKFGKLETTAFVSVRKLSSNVNADTSGSTGIISSFQTSGYHRTKAELEDKNDVRQFAAGANIQYKMKGGHFGVNAVSYFFSSSILKKPVPYNLYSIKGDEWSNFSIDYSYTYRNIHFFGEEAMDCKFNRAFLNGLLMSVDTKVDIALLHRHISAKYQAVYGDAFTENSEPTNECGLYCGSTIRPGHGWQVDLYFDFFKFPWLKYLVDAPSSGKDFLVQLSYTPNKLVEIISRFKTETKQSDNAASAVTNSLVEMPKWDWRNEISSRINSTITIRERVEILWYGNKVIGRQQGFLCFFDFGYKPPLKPFSIGARLQYFETSSFDSRIYAYENDVLYSFSIPASFGKGLRYYINVSYDLTRKLSLWCRWSQTHEPAVGSIGTALDEIKSNHRSDISFQVQWSL